MNIRKLLNIKSLFIPIFAIAHSFAITLAFVFVLTGCAMAIPGDISGADLNSVSLSGSNPGPDKNTGEDIEENNKSEDNMPSGKLENNGVQKNENTPNNGNNSATENAVVGGGCFWCLEAIFVQLKGVQSVESGYAGGYIENPTYQQVCSGNTGHAEVIKIVFDPEIISFRQLLEVFFYMHDPTTLNRQGNDVGTQYRSVILFNSPGQEKIANELVAELGRQKFFTDPIVTEIKPLEIFYKAEDYHQSYYENNEKQPYCQIVILPKFEKFEDKFADLLK